MKRVIRRSSNRRTRRVRRSKRTRRSSSNKRSSKRSRKGGWGGNDRKNPVFPSLLSGGWGGSPELSV